MLIYLYSLKHDPIPLRVVDEQMTQNETAVQKYKEEELERLGTVQVT